MKSIAIIGCAHIHTPGFVNTIKERGVPVAGVWDHDEARAAKNAEATSSSVKSIDALLDDPEVGAVLICSETNRHKDLVLPAADAGKALFVEKPLDASSSESLAMVEAIEKASVPFHTGYFMRGDASVVHLKKLVDSGHFGMITRVRFSNCHSGSLGGWFDGEWRWMADVEQAGVGAFGDLGTHSLDLMLWMFGPVEAVAGTLSMGTARYPGCDEVGEALIKFKSGVIGVLAAGWTAVANPVSAEVSGTAGHALLSGGLQVAGKDGKLEKVEGLVGERAGFGAFLDLLDGGSPDLVPIREAHERVVVMEAIYKAAAEQRWVAL